MSEVCYIALNGRKFRRSGRATVPLFTASVEDGGNEDGCMLFDVTMRKLHRVEMMTKLTDVVKKNGADKGKHIHMFNFDLKPNEADPNDHPNSVPVDFGYIALSDVDYKLDRGQLLNVPSIMNRKITIVVTSEDDPHVKDFAIDYSSSEIPFNPSESIPGLQSVIDIEHEFFKLGSNANVASSSDPEYDSSKNKSTEAEEKREDNPRKKPESEPEHTASDAVSEPVESSPSSKKFKSE